MRTERGSGRMILRGGGSSAGGRRRGRGGRGRGGRSRERWLSVASTATQVRSASLMLCNRIGVIYLVLYKDGPEAVEELEWGNDMALNEDGGDYCSCGPIACTSRHLIKPLLEGELAHGSSAASPTEHVIHIHDCGRF